MSKIKLLVMRCNRFYKLANILPPAMEDDFMPEIPKNPVPKSLEQDSVDTVRPIKHKHKKHHKHDDDEGPATIRSPGVLDSDRFLEPETIPTPKSDDIWEEVYIPRAPKVPKEFAITEPPPTVRHSK